MTVPQNGHSRASLGYMLIPILLMLEKIGILKGVENDVVETVEVLNNIKEKCGPEIPVAKNVARSLAFELLGRFPIVYGEQNFTDSVAIRWKQQFNENSKVHCYYDIFPELLHNEIEAWDSVGNVHGNYALILLRDLIYEHEVGLQEKINACRIYDPAKRGKDLRVLEGRKI